MIDALLVSLAAGWLRRGRWRNFAAVDLRGAEWIFLGALLQFGSLALALRGNAFFTAYGPHLFVLSFVPLLYGVWCMRTLPGMRWLLVGMLLNLLVIAANGGSMPVDPRAVEVAGLSAQAHRLSDAAYFTHQFADEGTVFWLLADILPVPPPYPRPRVFSIGDLLMLVGVFMAVQRVMLHGPPKGRSTAVTG